ETNPEQIKKLDFSEKLTFFLAAMLEETRRAGHVFIFTRLKSGVDSTPTSREISKSRP
ncbi:MAG: hypothetical protein GY755_24900, partial [Chloroflexi bacterium]|nr:hypothetical protein [Chloroflexota bacterium]